MYLLDVSLRNFFLCGSKFPCRWGQLAWLNSGAPISRYSNPSVSYPFKEVESSTSPKRVAAGGSTWRAFEERSGHDTLAGRHVFLP